jgi:hypothetical protein
MLHALDVVASRARTWVVAGLMVVSLGARPAAAQDAPGVRVSGFSSTTFAATVVEGEEEGEEAVGRTGFSAAGIDLLLVSDFDEKTRFIGELNFLFETPTELEIFVDRAQMWIALTPTLAASLGVLRLPMGYFRTRQSERHFLYYTATTPSFLRDDLGLAPEALVGALLEGRLALSSRASLQYHVGVGNGRGSFPEAKNHGADQDDSKAVAAGFELSLPEVSGLELGVHGYYDQFDATGVMAKALKIRQAMGIGFAKIETARLLAMGEYMFLRTEDTKTDTVASSQFFYALAVLHLGTWHPFARFDGLLFSDTLDPYTSLEGEGGMIMQEQRENTMSVSAGVAYDAYARLRLKLEAQKGVSGSQVTQVFAQAACAF